MTSFCRRGAAASICLSPFSDVSHERWRRPGVFVSERTMSVRGVGWSRGVRGSGWTAATVQGLRNLMDEHFLSLLRAANGSGCDVWAAATRLCVCVCMEQFDRYLKEPQPSLSQRFIKIPPHCCPLAMSDRHEVSPALLSVFAPTGAFAIDVLLSVRPPA